MITAEVLGVEKTLGMFERFPDRAQKNMAQTVERLAVKLRDFVKSGFLSDQVLHVRTGRLRRSITYKLNISATTYQAIIGTNVKYARIHEFGGQTSPHDIRPVRARALMFGSSWAQQTVTSKMGRYLKSKSAREATSAFLASGDLRFAKVVHHPGSKIPERSFLRAALNAMKPEILLALRKAMSEASK